MGSSSPEKTLHVIVISGLFAMLKAWFTRCLGGHAFPGHAPFRAWSRGGRVYYFRLFAPTAVLAQIRNGRRIGITPLRDLWVRMHRQGGPGPVGSWFRKDRELLFLHEALYHVAANNHGHDPAGVGAAGMLVRHRTTPWEDVEEHLSTLLSCFNEVAVYNG